MAKIQIKNEKITPFGGIFPIMDYFDRKLVPTSYFTEFCLHLLDLVTN